MRFHEPVDPNYAPKHRKNEPSDIEALIFSAEGRLELGLRQYHTYTEDENLILDLLSVTKALIGFIEDAAVQEQDEAELKRAQSRPPQTPATREQVEAILRLHERAKARGSRVPPATKLVWASEGDPETGRPPVTPEKRIIGSKIPVDPKTFEYNFTPDTVVHLNHTPTAEEIVQRRIEALRRTRGAERKWNAENPDNKYL